MLTHSEGSSEALRVVRLERGKGATIVDKASTLDVLREEFGSDVQMVPCGGEDPLYQEREQWTDGANAVCVSPAHIILYARNIRTIQKLRDYGFEEIPLSLIQDQDTRRDLIRQGMERERTVFSFNEASSPAPGAVGGASPCPFGVTLSTPEPTTRRAEHEHEQQIRRLLECPYGRCRPRRPRLHSKGPAGQLGRPHPKREGHLRSADDSGRAGL